MCNLEPASDEPIEIDVCRTGQRFLRILRNHRRYKRTDGSDCLRAKCGDVRPVGAEPCAEALTAHPVPWHLAARLQYLP